MKNRKGSKGANRRDKILIVNRDNLSTRKEQESKKQRTSAAIDIAPRRGDRIAIRD